MALNENGGEFISLSEAEGYVSAYRKLYPTAAKGYYAGGDNIQKILEQDGCIGIRIYNGYDGADNKTNLVIVGVDNAENDMTDGLILEKIRHVSTFLQSYKCVIQSVNDEINDYKRCDQYYAVDVRDADFVL